MARDSYYSLQLYLCSVSALLAAEELQTEPRQDISCWAGFLSALLSYFFFFYSSCHIFYFLVVRKDSSDTELLPS